MSDEWETEGGAIPPSGDDREERIEKYYEESAYWLAESLVDAEDRCDLLAESEVALAKDNDQLQEKVRDLMADRARLRSDLDTATGLGETLGDEVTRLRGEAQANYDEGKALAGVLDREIARLRAELEQQVETDAQRLHTQIVRAVDAEATIERQRGLLTEIEGKLRVVVRERDEALDELGDLP